MFLLVRFYNAAGKSHRGITFGKGSLYRNTRLEVFFRIRTYYPVWSTETVTQYYIFSVNSYIFLKMRIWLTWFIIFQYGSVFSGRQSPSEMVSSLLTCSRVVVFAKCPDYCCHWSWLHSIYVQKHQTQKRMSSGHFPWEAAVVWWSSEVIWIPLQTVQGKYHFPLKILSCKLVNLISCFLKNWN